MHWLLKNGEMSKSYGHSCDTFRAVVEHSGFHPDQFDGDVVQLPLFSAFATGLERANEGDPVEGIVEKFKILLEVGADPELDLGNGLSSLGVCKTVLSRYDFSGRSPDSRNGRKDCGWRWI